MLKIDRRPDKAESFHSFVKNKGLRTWDDFNEYPTEKAALRRELEEDQNHLDGYTEQSLIHDGRNKVNIEHFRCWAKFNWPKECFNYYNYVVANKDTRFGGDYKDTKIHKDDYEIIFNPIEDNMALYVEYELGTGKMIPREGIDSELKNRVYKTIDIFNLSHEILNASRKSLMDEMVSWLTPECLKQFGDIDRNEIRGWFADRPYPTMIDWYLDTFLDNIPK